MRKKIWLFMFCLVILLTVAVLTLTIGSKPASKKDALLEVDRAVASAKALYKKRAVEGLDVSNGPCLTNDLMPGWVVDLVHSPREPVDNLSQNQCPAYLEGRASHFVELDLNGNLVRVR